MRGTPAQDEFCRIIGWNFCGVVSAIDRLGWERPTSAQPYIRSMRTPVTDLLLWEAGDMDARDGLLSCLPEWREALDRDVNDMLRKGRAA